MLKKVLVVVAVVVMSMVMFTGCGQQADSAVDNASSVNNFRLTHNCIALENDATKIKLYLGVEEGEEANEIHCYGMRVYSKLYNTDVFVYEDELDITLGNPSESIITVTYNDEMSIMFSTNYECWNSLNATLDFWYDGHGDYSLEYNETESVWL